MTILKQRLGCGEIKSDNIKEITKIFGEDAVRVQKFMIKSNSKLTYQNTYDPQSGWEGKFLQLNGIELKGNGYQSIIPTQVYDIIGDDSAKYVLQENQIREAYTFLREKNHSIPSDILELMLGASLDRLKDVKKESDVLTFAEWINIKGIRWGQHDWQYQGNGYKGTFTTTEMYEFFLKDPK